MDAIPTRLVPVVSQTENPARIVSSPTPQSTHNSDIPVSLDVNCSRKDDTIDIEGSSVKIVEETFTPLKLVIDLIPQFDGITCSLTRFIKDCRIAYRSVKPSEKCLLLRHIRNRIVGHADALIRGNPDPDTLDELINHLKEAFSDQFVFPCVLNELRGVRQGERETIGVFGGRVREILTRGIEAAREQYDPNKFTAFKELLDTEAVAGFARGLLDRVTSQLIIGQRLSSLNTAIKNALDIKLTSDISVPNFLVQNAKVFVTTAPSEDPRKCFECGQKGHLRLNCPRNSSRKPPPIREQRCGRCRKTGHSENHCYRGIQQNPQNFDKSIPGATYSQNLNWNRGPCRGVTRNQPLIARATPTEKVYFLVKQTKLHSRLPYHFPTSSLRKVSLPSLSTQVLN